MKTRIAFAVLFVVCLSSDGLAQVKPAAPHPAGSARRWIPHTVKTIHGWKVYIDPSMRNHGSLLKSSDSILNFELGVIEQRIPAAAIGQLKEVPLWLSLNSHSGRILHLYHSMANWARKRPDLDPAMEGAIEIQAPDYANMPHDSLPLLKWLAYSYHQQALGLHNQTINDAFEHAKSSHVYDVQINNQQHFPFRISHDYFAVLSEAYFGGPLSYAPFDKARLKQMDPQGYDMIETLWKLKG
ncbi:MAG: hypothetical protein Q8922_15325 [Bacteroidota bacterium]|nr:hypothetical protein [Bacteroidota bacterium]MDP4232628.1 hypothetical protein [Bacteroidota bacterium]MDP4243880.1 hypothetical protein [Bacteroidota bacterium]MDP4289288.1 hypothetical protein [Bacteroidota bacterium]